MYYGETGFLSAKACSGSRVTDWCMCDEDFACVFMTNKMSFFKILYFKINPSY